MKISNSEIALINRHLYSGLKFHCKDDEYTFISYDHNEVTIQFFDRLEQIPFDLFYVVMMEDNQEQIEIWDGQEHESLFEIIDEL